MSVAISAKEEYSPIISFFAVDIFLSKNFFSSSVAVPLIRIFFSIVIRRSPLLRYAACSGMRGDSSVGVVLGMG